MTGVKEWQTLWAGFGYNTDYVYWGKKKKAFGTDTAKKNCPVSCDGSHPCGYAHAPLIFTAAGCQKE